MAFEISTFPLSLYIALSPYPPTSIVPPVIFNVPALFTIVFSFDPLFVFGYSPTVPPCIITSPVLLFSIPLEYIPYVFTVPSIISIFPVPSFVISL